MTNPAAPNRVAEILARCLPEARLNRVPRHPDHRDVVLAILCLDLRRRYPYSEREINEALGDALDGLNARVDHVTCRRYLVDLGFVRRDRAGHRYLVNYPKVEATLSEEAMAAAPELIRNALTARRGSPRRRAAKKVLDRA
jgi:hypothetical protein